MGLFGRRDKDPTDESVTPVDPADPADPSDPAGTGEAGDVEPASNPVIRSEGPWDEADDAPEAERVDLGALLVPQSGAYRIQVQADQTSGVITQVSLVTESSAVQLQPYAAPRTGGMWDDVRGQISAQINKSGGLVEQATGPFGIELRAQMKGNDGVPQPARFCGVDGPRWFLRLVFLGQAARDASAAQEMEAAVRNVIVVRGDQAMPMGNALPMRVPMDTTATTPVDAPAAPARPTITLPERGPEITETR